VTQSDVQDRQSAATSGCMQMTQLQYKVISEKPSVLVRVRAVMIALDSGRCPMAEWIISAMSGVKVLKCTTRPYCMKSGASQRDECSGLATLVTLRKRTWGSRAVGGRVQSLDA
jgi:hypothetical protein